MTEQGAAAASRPVDDPQPMLLVWAFALVQLPALFALTIWLLATPTLFGAYYPYFARTEPLVHDAIRINAWLNGHGSKEALGIGLRHGTLREKEIAHFVDVRAWLRRAKTIALSGLVALAMLACYTRGRVSRFSKFLVAAEARSLCMLLAGSAAAVIVAAWDWKVLFAWVHYPLFGPTSWKLPSSSYSLLLFPQNFWRGMGIGMLGLPMLASLAAWITSWRIARRPTALAA